MTHRIRLIVVLTASALLADLASALPAYAQQGRPSSQQSKQDRMSRLLKAVDKDNDGAISLDEAKQYASARFDRYDTNHDGKLTLQEFQAASRAATSNPQHQERGMKLREKMFRAMDKNRNGTVEKDEYFAAIEERFQKADPDRDGTLTVEELRSREGRSLADLIAP